MREIPVSRITDAVERLCIEANTHLPDDVKRAIEACRACEDGDIAVGVLDNIMENYQIADRECVPICQDTGMACVFLEIGQDVHLTGGDLREAVDEGVRRGYINGYLRKSVVRDPVRRGNTGDNTPAVLYTEIVPGEQVKITLAPKGFGSENMSAIRMFKPSAGLQGIKDFILETVEAAGPNPCPPIVVGVGIGGTFDKAALLAKKALMRPLDTRNPDPFYADLEKEMLETMKRELWFTALKQLFVTAACICLGEFILNLLPSGILRDETVNVMGPGMVIDLEHLFNEIHPDCGLRHLCHRQHLYFAAALFHGLYRCAAGIHSLHRRHLRLYADLPSV